jgi:hypothetical protein
MLPAWLLALIVLIVCSAIGVYYLNPDLYWFVPEGFDVRSDAAACESERTLCINAGFGNSKCTTAYNTCTAAAAAKNPLVSKTTPAPSSPNQIGSSAAATQAFVKMYKDGSYAGDLGTGDKTNANVYNTVQAAALAGIDPKDTVSYKKFLDSIASRRSVEYDKPTDYDLSLAQGDDTGYSGAAVGAKYSPNQVILKPHMTPAELKAAIAASVLSDKGTKAQKIKEDSIQVPTLRDMIRNDVKKAVREEIDEINNEYEIKYE